MAKRHNTYGNDVLTIYSSVTHTKFKKGNERKYAQAAIEAESFAKHRAKNKQTIKSVMSLIQ